MGCGGKRITFRNNIIQRTVTSTHDLQIIGPAHGNIITGNQFINVNSTNSIYMDAGGTPTRDNIAGDNICSAAVVDATAGSNVLHDNIVSYTP